MAVVKAVVMDSGDAESRTVVVQPSQTIVRLDWYDGVEGKVFVVEVAPVDKPRAEQEFTGSLAFGSAMLAFEQALGRIVMQEGGQA